jgi:hypothetical protein
MKSCAEYRGIVATDFDGTLHGKEEGITAADLASLRQLGEEGFSRVIATGRSPYSFYSAIGEDFPADYLVFSSGSGVLEVHSGRVLRHLTFEPQQVTRLLRMLRGRNVDFMLHLPVPLNHHFFFHASADPDPDFLRRLELYGRFASPLPPRDNGGESELIFRRRAAQIVAIFHGESRAADELAEEAAMEAGVVRATSPLDGRSTWIELYPPGTDKGSTLEWLAASLGISRERCMGIGNDYNDLHMLEWCGTAFAVSNAPEELRRRYRTVAPYGSSGFTEAVELWKRELREDGPL